MGAFGGGVKSVQSGTITITSGNSSNTDTITAVGSKSELRLLGFTYASSTSSVPPQESFVKIIKTNSTTITANTAANVTADMIVAYEITDNY